MLMVGKIGGTKTDLAAIAIELGLSLPGDRSDRRGRRRRQLDHLRSGRLAMIGITLS
jgi:hypothetical protein